MKSDIKQLWVDALRSGDYEQGKNKLSVWNQDGDEIFCCLGVLCDIAIKSGLDIPVTDYCYEESDWLDGAPEELAGCYIYDDTTELLPDAVMKWAGIDTPEVRVPGTGTSLSHLNDNGASFEAIASVIERYL